MPKYRKSKSQKRSSQSQSKNGGRRRKRTMRKLRRGRKSRKVMRGGGNITEYVMKLSDKSESLYNILKLDDTITDQEKLRTLINLPKYKYSINLWYKELFGKEPESELNPDDIKNAIIEKLESNE